MGGKGKPQNTIEGEAEKGTTALAHSSHARDARGGGGDSERKKGEAQRASRNPPRAAQAAKLEISRGDRRVGGVLSAPGPGSR